MKGAFETTSMMGGEEAPTTLVNSGKDFTMAMESFLMEIPTIRDFSVAVYLVVRVFISQENT